MILLSRVETLLKGTLFYRRMGIWHIIIALLLVSTVSAETNQLLDAVRLEPATICAGESTVLFIDVNNQRSSPLRDATLHVSSPNVELGFSEHSDFPLGHTTRLMQFSVPQDARGDYPVTVELSDGTQETLSAVLQVLPCTQDTHEPVFLPHSQKKPSAVAHYTAVAGIVTLQLVVALAVISIAFMLVRSRRKKPEQISHGRSIKKKKKPKSK